jgi:hypothetical protein
MILIESYRNFKVLKIDVSEILINKKALIMNLLEIDLQGELK